MRRHNKSFQPLVGAISSIACTQNTDIVVKPVFRHKRHVYVAPAVKPKETSGQLLLYYYYIVQVEHKRDFQLGNIRINITEVCLNTLCNYMYCTFKLTNPTFKGTCYVTPISLTVIPSNNKSQLSVIHKGPIFNVKYLFFF